MDFLKFLFCVVLAIVILNNKRIQFWLDVFWCYLAGGILCAVSVGAFALILYVLFF